MLFVAPGLLLRGEQGVGRLSKGDAAGAGAPLGRARLERIDAVGERFSHAAGELTRLGE